MTDPPPQPISTAPATELTAVELWGASLSGGLLLWAALPPLSWSLLAFVAPIPWLWLVAHPANFGRGTYAIIWIAMSLHWLAVLEGIRHAHPAVNLGWVALSCYLAVFFTLFIWLAHEAVHRWRWPIWIAAPVLWVAFEYLRGFGPFAFSACLLGHTQLASPELIQIADLVGGYGVSFVVMLVAACLLASYSRSEESGEMRMNYAAPAALIVVLLMTLLYGRYRLAEFDTHVASAAKSEKVRPTRVALLQGTQDTAFDGDPSRDFRTFEQYYRLAQKALADHPDLQLVVWPETCFPIGANRVPDESKPGEFFYEPGLPWFIINPGELQSPQEAPAWFGERLRRLNALATRWTGDALRKLSPPGNGVTPMYVVGIGAVAYGPHPPARYNSALLFDRNGGFQSRYDKTCPVAFGEYIPLGDFFPWLYSITPLGGGLTPGRGPAAFEVDGKFFAPSICFESTLPSLVRSQVSELDEAYKTPDALLNITNDGWFWGSSILDIHLTCSAFRALENRRPMLVAANTGITAHIDAAGRIPQQLPRREEGVLIAEVDTAKMGSFYTETGDWFSAACLLTATVVAGFAIYRGLFRAKELDSPQAIRE